MDETYVKVKGRWVYLYRAVDKRGDTIDFYLSPTRNAKAAKRFLGKALKGRKDWEMPYVINTDKAGCYPTAIAELKQEGKCPQATEHRQVKYLNYIVEADHGKLKRLIRPTLGFSLRERHSHNSFAFAILCNRAHASYRLLLDRNDSTQAV